jgi:hypothetical protein
LDDRIKRRKSVYLNMEMNTLAEISDIVPHLMKEWSLKKSKHENVKEIEELFKN